MAIKNMKSGRESLGVKLANLRTSSGKSKYRVQKDSGLQMSQVIAIEEGRSNYGIDSLLAYMDAIGCGELAPSLDEAGPQDQRHQLILGYEPRSELDQMQVTMRLDLVTQSFTVSEVNADPITAWPIEAFWIDKLGQLNPVGFGGVFHASSSNPLILTWKNDDGMVIATMQTGITRLWIHEGMEVEEWALTEYGLFGYEESPVRYCYRVDEYIDGVRILRGYEKYLTDATDLATHKRKCVKGGCGSSYTKITRFSFSRDLKFEDDYRKIWQDVLTEIEEVLYFY